jgi:hypothetical protein
MLRYVRDTLLTGLFGFFLSYCQLLCSAEFFKEQSRIRFPISDGIGNLIRDCSLVTPWSADKVRLNIVTSRVSLSIPESAKPGLYARMRKIVNAETLWAAITGATVLAVLVNIIELLCTAGLPALYTNVLMMQGFPVWKNYAYLGLYNLAYMFDDSVMVIIAVFTLGRRKLQEKEGRWLKLVSGVLILALGVVMLYNPELLMWELS